MTQIHTVTLPDIGEGVVEGEVIEWLKNEGDTLNQDEPVAIVMTDKATVELPAPYPGKMGQRYAEVGQMAIRDMPLYDIELAEGISAPKQKQTVLKTATPASQSTKRASSGKVLATPAVRKLAQDMGIDLASIQGSGDEGRITRSDLLHQHPIPTLSRPTTPPLHLEDDREIPLIGVRRLTAQRMAESKQMAPHFSYFDQASATQLIKLRSKIKPEALEEGIRLTYMPFFIGALSKVISKFPEINASVDTENNQLLVHQHHHIGIAMSSELGLVVPVLADVQLMNIADVIRSYEELKQAARDGKIPPKQMTGSTMTISNFGTLGGGGTFATPIINYPEVAILALNRIRPQAVVKNGKIIAQETLNVSWSFDHRVIDGDMAAAVSHEFISILENPSHLL